MIILEDRPTIIASGNDVVKGSRIFNASRAGHAKPSREIFQSALRLYDLKPHEAMHVGDSLENDAAGAARAGLEAVWLNRNGGGTAQLFSQVRSLREILSLVD